MFDFPSVPSGLALGRLNGADHCVVNLFLLVKSLDCISLPASRALRWFLVLLSVRVSLQRVSRLSCSRPTATSSQITSR